MLENEQLAQRVCECLGLPCPEPDLKAWRKLTADFEDPKHKVTIAIVGKYVALHDAYLSVVEALKHGGIANLTEVEIRWVDAEDVTIDNAEDILDGVDGMIVPGGFGSRGTEGKIAAAHYARTNNIPYLGICLGMQLAIVEFARYACGLADAASSELSPETKNPVIHILPEKEHLEDIGGTLRLGSYPCVLTEGTKAYKLYGKKEITERHRHRYEVNNDYRQILTENGMVLSGMSPDKRIVEMIELKDHPYFVATQAHPEFKSRPDMPHPLFAGLIRAALDHKGSDETERRDM
jgi:CTP synthase